MSISFNEEQQYDNELWLVLDVEGICNDIYLTRPTVEPIQYAMNVTHADLLTREPGECLIWSVRDKYCTEKLSL